MRTNRFFISIAILLIRMFSITSAGEVCAQDYPTQKLKQYAAAARVWLADTARVRETADNDPHFLDAIFSWPEITIKAFSEHWINLSKTWQQKFQSAIRKKLIHRFTEYLLLNRSLNREQALRWGDEVVRDQKAQVSADILMEQEIVNLNIRLIWEKDRWKIYDIRTERFSFNKKYFPDIQDLLDEGYNPEYLYAHVMDDSVLIIDNFNQGTADEFPSGWGWPKKDDSDMRLNQKKYYISQAADGQFLASFSSGLRIPLVRPFSYNIQEYPYLSWKWRLTAGRNSLNSDLTDELSGASVTVIFFQNWLGIPVSITYIWAPDAVECSTLDRSSWIAKNFTIVLRADKDTSWQQETVQPYQDYSRLYGEPPPDQIIGLYLQTLSPLESVFIRADYDDLIAGKSFSRISCQKK